MVVGQKASFEHAHNGSRHRARHMTLKESCEIRLPRYGAALVMRSLMRMLFFSLLGVVPIQPSLWILTHVYTRYFFQRFSCFLPSVAIT
jgi:hypothetical protein